MSNAMRSILYQASRQPNDPINVLTFSTHERFQGNLVYPNINFYLYNAPGVKTWNKNFGPLPSNHYILRTLVDGEPIQAPLPKYVDFSCVWSQSKQGQYNLALGLSKYLHVGLIVTEHTLPYSGWKTPQALQQLKQMKGDINTFITTYSQKEWTFDDTESEVIYHGIDTNVFKMLGLERKPHILSVVNDWINRDVPCGFNLWRQSTQGLPVHPIGATPNLSLPAKSLDDLVNEYNTSMVFFNTSLISPIPTSLLEAAACGCAIVSTDNCAIPELIEHGVNGFLSNSPEGIRYHCQELLKNPALCAEFGMRARRTVKEKFNKETFVNKWNSVFERAANIIFKG